MREERRIKHILKMVETYWNQNPDQRFCQVLINLGLAHDNIDYWKFEDDKLIKQLEPFIKEIEQEDVTTKSKTKK